MNVDGLLELGACSEAIEWAQAQPDAKTAWANCKRGGMDELDR